MFDSYGAVERVSIVTDRDTGQARGFAFVEMAKDDEAAKAMTELNGKEVSGRALRVNEATPKPERGGPRAPGGFDSRGGGGKKAGGSRGRGGFSTEDYRGSARQPKEPRW
jgi:RNA recognition motif-containing protein